MKEDTNRIAEDLYRKSYIEQTDPQEFISSHWQLYHHNIKVHLLNGKIESLKGFGFGDMQSTSLPERLLSFMTIISYLCVLRNRKKLIDLMKTAIPLAWDMGFPFSYDCFRQVCTLQLIMGYMNKEEKSHVILVIGDGYGYLSALLKKKYPKATVIMVDLGKVLLFQAFFCRKTYPDARHDLISDTWDKADLPNIDFLYCPAENIDMLEGIAFDMAINIASMQEMNKKTIERYFHLLRNNLKRNNLFYCCNREEKVMPGGEVSRFLDYPWSGEDIYLLDEICPWHIFFYGIRSGKSPRLLGLPIPFLNYFEGEHRHRLSVLRTNNAL